MQKPYPTAPATERDLDEGIKESFPASDTPSMVSQLTASPSESTGAATRATAAEAETVTVYRVVDEEQKEKPFAPPENASAGRWTSKESQAVYASMSASAALLEYLAHCDGNPPEQAYMAKARLPRERVTTLEGYPSTWRERPYRDEVRQAGDRWVESHESLAAEVPSALCDDASNVLINPRHVDMPLIQGVSAEPISIDPRLRGAAG